MKPEYISLMQEVDLYVKDPMERAKILGIAISAALANSSDMPSTEVEDPSTYFINQVSTTIRSLVSDLNENVVFDLKQVMENVRVFWMLRYHALYPYVKNVFFSTHTFFENLYGAGATIPPDLYEYANCNKEAISKLMPTVNSIVYSLGETDAS